MATDGTHKQEMILIKMGLAGICWKYSSFLVKNRKFSPNFYHCSWFEGLKLATSKFEKRNFHYSQ